MAEVKETKLFIFLDKEDIKRMEGTIKFDGDLVRLSSDGDIEFVRAENNAAVGRGCGLDEKNKKLADIIKAGQNVQIQVYKKGGFVPIDVTASDGMLDLRKIVKKAK